MSRVLPSCCASFHNPQLQVPWSPSDLGMPTLQRVRRQRCAYDDWSSQWLHCSGGRTVPTKRLFKENAPFSFVILPFWLFLDFPTDRSISAHLSEGIKTLRSLRKERKTQKSSLTSEEKVAKVMGSLLEHSFLEHFCLDQFSIIQCKFYMQGSRTPRLVKHFWVPIFGASCSNKLFVGTLRPSQLLLGMQLPPDHKALLTNILRNKFCKTTTFSLLSSSKCPPFLRVLVPTNPIRITQDNSQKLFP